MSGDTIPSLSYGQNLDKSIVLKLHVQADPGAIFSFPIKVNTRIPGQRKQLNF